MRILLQKTTGASVSVHGEQIGAIAEGYVLFFGALKGDTLAEVDWLVRKILQLRLFEGENGKVNDRSILDVHGEILLISQFTLAGVVQKGNRPDYTMAAPPDEARSLYEYAIRSFEESGIRIACGSFGAHMEVSLVNDGPVTLMLERTSDGIEGLSSDS